MAVRYTKGKGAECRGLYRRFFQALQCQDINPTADTSLIIPSMSFPIRQKLSFVRHHFSSATESSLNKGKGKVIPLEARCGPEVG